MSWFAGTAIYELTDPLGCLAGQNFTVCVYRVGIGIVRFRAVRSRCTQGMRCRLDRTGLVYGSYLRARRQQQAITPRTPRSQECRMASALPGTAESQRPPRRTRSQPPTPQLAPPGVSRDGARAATRSNRPGLQPSPTGRERGVEGMPGRKGISPGVIGPIRLRRPVAGDQYR